MDVLIDRILRCLPAPPGPSALPLPAAFEPATYSSGRHVHITTLPEDIQRQIVSKLPMKASPHHRPVLKLEIHLAHHPLDLDANSLRERASYACPNTEEILRCTSLVRLYVAVCNLPYTGGHHVRFPELLELGLCSTGLCQEDFDRVLAGSPKLENLAFISGRVALTRIDLVCPRLRCVVFWHAVPSHELAMVDAPCLERVILWEEDTYSLVPCKIKIGCAPVLRAIGYLNPILHVLQIGDQLITVPMPHRILMELEFSGRILSSDNDMT
ncbi:hypothetical protein ZWY2020_006716 [Hordeum vulgare]|nr:hypothetical protein ZWY2020_006716 [Hordeum vulgare]